MQALTSKQRAFCSEYVKDENRRQAAIRAGYSPKAASQEASRLWQDERIQDLISKLPGYRVPIDDMSLDGHLRKMAVLRDKLEEAGENADITTPQVSAMRGAIDAETARGKVLGFNKPPGGADKPPLGEGHNEESISQLIRGTVLDSGNGVVPNSLGDEQTGEGF